ncbi:hypothetical protein GQX73_g8565 [Xylaria multiplex]|uniref:Uncharacterized protein n=1 Tax=Xylaria multiplex TaxID=323545 RepID=A0A7C8MPV9_9PEZI|nr:hypothetical protein GQX73_g8565 [Xylaria multiplex]
MGPLRRKNGTQPDPWWRPELRANNYEFGEAHDDEATYLGLAKQWAVDGKTLDHYPYLSQVKRLSEAGWTHLRLLVDFMSIGTVPQRWKDLDTNLLLSPKEVSDRQAEREERIERTNVSVLDYYATEVKRVKLTSAQALRDSLGNQTENNSPKFRLYVVEDLSRDVIEILGQKFGIEPDFFRAHIVDYAWYNVRDRWRNPSMLDIVSRHQNWMQLRYVTARYFDVEKEHRRKDSREAFKEAGKEAANFNILRRPDDDLSNNAPQALIPIQILLHLICSEWVTMSDYIKTRMNQLDWEITKPEFFGLGKEGVDNMLEKLHMWRRLVPLYREMVSETIRHIEQFSCRIETLAATLESGPTKGAQEPTTNPALAGTPVSGQAHRSLIGLYDPDFKLIKEQLEEYQTRIDQLTSVVTAVISIENSRRSLEDNRNIGRLTLLATIFIPLSLVAGILSMQSDVSDISSDTFKVYFATSVPLAIVIAAFTLTLSLSGSENRKKLMGIKRAMSNLQGR